jgi:cell wall-associated NlpC family hydrolase
MFDFMDFTLTKNIAALALGFALFLGFLFSFPAKAEDVPAKPLVIPPPPRVTFINRATASAQDVLDKAVDMLGIPYRFGGNNPESGFDCSGFVRHVFLSGLGLILPRSSFEQSKAGQVIPANELKPGDLVFFNTMRRAFSHVGIYLGNDQFVHAPRTGDRIRVDNLSDSYWMQRFNGARRVNPE